MAFIAMPTVALAWDWLSLKSTAYCNPLILDGDMRGDGTESDPVGCLAKAVELAALGQSLWIKLGCLCKWLNG